MKVRIARPDDLSSVLEVEHRCFKEPNTNLITRVCGVADLMYVAETELPEQKDTAGYILCAPENSERARVVSLAVLPDYQGNGIGTRLMQRAITEVTAREFGSVVLEVRVSNESALSLYRGLGFERIGIKRGYYDDGEDAYFMEKSLR